VPVIFVVAVVAVPYPSFVVAVAVVVVVVAVVESFGIVVVLSWRTIRVCGLLFQ